MLQACQTDCTGMQQIRISRTKNGDAVSSDPFNVAAEKRIQAVGHRHALLQGNPTLALLTP